MKAGLTNNFLNLLMAGNRIECSKIVHELIEDGVSYQEIYEDVLKKSLYKIGELWEFNKISVATEHLSSAIVEALLNEIYTKIIPPVKIKNTILVACVENEYHQIGIKMISDVFEVNAWNSYFLGANTPVHELIDYAQEIKPDVLALSLSVYFNLPVLEKMIHSIRIEFPETPILVGGQAFLRGGKAVIEKYPNVIYQYDLKSTELFIKAFKNG